MSEAAYLVCASRRMAMRLGKPLRREDDTVIRFTRGTERGPNSAQPALSKALWKFLAETAGESLVVKTDYSDDFEVVAAYRIVGDDARGNLTYEDYVEGFDG